MYLLIHTNSHTHPHPTKKNRNTHTHTHPPKHKHKHPPTYIQTAKYILWENIWDIPVFCSWSTHIFDLFENKGEFFIYSPIQTSFLNLWDTLREFLNLFKKREGVWVLQEQNTGKCQILNLTERYLASNLTDCIQFSKRKVNH